MTLLTPTQQREALERIPMRHLSCLLGDEDRFYWMQKGNAGGTYRQTDIGEWYEITTREFRILARLNDKPAWSMPHRLFRAHRESSPRHLVARLDKWEQERADLWSESRSFRGFMTDEERLATELRNRHFRVAARICTARIDAAVVALLPDAHEPADLIEWAEVTA